jgi:hypothetical protein
MSKHSLPRVETQTISPRRMEEDLPIIAQRKIGGTTYIVYGKWKKEGETLKDKIWRLIENDNS